MYRTPTAMHAWGSLVSYEAAYDTTSTCMALVGGHWNPDHPVAWLVGTHYLRRHDAPRRTAEQQIREVFER